MSDEVETVVEEKPKGPAQKTEPAREVFSREYVQELREENKAIRIKTAEAEKQLEELKSAKLTADKEKVDQMSQLQKETQTKVALAKLEALAVKEGIVDIDALKLMDSTGLKFDESGEVTNAAEVIEAFKTAKPFYFGSAATSSTKSAPPPAKTGATSAKDMDDKAWLAEKKRMGVY